MSQRVVLSLGVGNINAGFPAVTAQLWEGDNPYPMKFRGSLPAAPGLPQLYQAWRLLYQALHYRLDWNPRIEVDSADMTHVSQVEFSDICQQFVSQMNDWLSAATFRSIEQALRTHLHTAADIRFLIETDDRLLQRLPWHLWHFFEDYANAEVALAAPEYQRAVQLNGSKSHRSSKQKARILAILGDPKGINLDPDRQLLTQWSAEAEIHFLVQPDRAQLQSCLWQPWDMLFFAGHSSSHDRGQIQINATDSLSLEQLRYALKRAIGQGLQLVVFNSCDGLELAQQLADLQIPQVIVMREPVPDVVAHAFLKGFLTAFARGQSLYASVRETRERLQALEADYPCATWLPIIYQNPAIAPSTWRDWCGVNRPLPCRTPLPWQRHLQTLLLASLTVTGLIMGIRWLGWLQPWELQAFDHLMRSRPTEQPDPRLLIVTITEEDFHLPEQQQRQGSLADVALLKLLDRLEAAKPRLIGLDLYRDTPAGSAELTQRMRQNDRLFAVCQVRDPAAGHPGIAPPAGVPIERQGFSDVVKDADGVLRRYLLAMQPGPASPCSAPYALSSRLAAHYLAAEGIRPHYTPDGTLQIGQVRLQRLRSRMGVYQGVDAGGYQTLINYRAHASPLEVAATVSLGEVLAGKLAPDQVRDRIVLIGVIAQSAHDYLPTPYSSQPGVYQEMPGVMVQAQLISQILSAVKDGRPLLRFWPLAGEGVWIGGWAVAGGLVAIGICVLSKPGPQSLVYWILAAGIAIAMLYLLCLLWLIHGVWVPLIPSVVAFLGSGSLVVGDGFRSRRLIRSEVQQQ